LDAPIFVLDSRERWRPVGVEESVALHGYEWREGDFWKADRRVARLDFPDEMEPPKLPPVGYHRVKTVREFDWQIDWHQWWLWYPHNPKKYAGFGEHEGDWEFVQVGYAAGMPVLATCSQHQTGGKREVWDAERRSKRLVIYVARDSHANYFEAVRTAQDTADGKGALLEQIEWREFEDWRSWNGRWGNSDTSPSSPARQRPRWPQPHLFHSQAR
jgi:hypothetical protein